MIGLSRTGTDGLRAALPTISPSPTSLMESGLLLYGLIVTIHIVAGFVWFGLSLRLQAFGKLDLTERIAEVGRKTAAAMTGAAVLLWAGGLTAGLISDQRLFHPDHPYSFVYTTSVLLILALVGVQVFGIARTWKKYVSGEVAGKKVMMWIGIGHLLWFVTLILMLWPQYFGPALG